jgi:hypothetical protein
MAAIDALNDIAHTSMCEHWEYGGSIYQFSDGSFSYTPARKGPQPFMPGYGMRPSGSNQASGYHTHPVIPGRNPWGFSPGDYEDSYYNGGEYILEPNGNIVKNTPASGAPDGQYSPTRRGTDSTIFTLRKLHKTADGCGCTQ